jgi:hypothetical protein
MGPYLRERQWGTVREDYSDSGDAWNTSVMTTPARGPIAGARTDSRGVSDERQRLCFSLALWNGKDAILKERLFRLTLPPQRLAAEMSKLKTSREVLRRRRIR